MSAPKLHITIPPGLLDKLKGMAADAGLPVNDFIVAVAAQHAIGGSPPAQRRGPVGRPPMPAVDLPANVERAATASGFAGVYPSGKLWTAKAGRESLGKFSTPELAAMIRHYTILGFRVGRGAFLGDQGFDPASAMEYALRAGYGAMPNVPVAPTAQVGPAIAHPAPPGPAESAGGRSGPAAGPGQVTAGPRATSADGERTPSTSPTSVAQMDVLGQLLDVQVGARVALDVFGGAAPPDPTAVPVMLGPVMAAGLAPTRGGCPVCHGPMNPAIARVHPHLCLLCSDDYTAWEALPPGGAITVGPPPDVYDSTVLTQGAPAAESFSAYVHRVRGL